MFWGRDVSTRSAVDRQLFCVKGRWCDYCSGERSLDWFVETGGGKCFIVIRTI